MTRVLSFFVGLVFSDRGHVRKCDSKMSQIISINYADVYNKLAEKGILY